MSRVAIYEGLLRLTDAMRCDSRSDGEIRPQGKSGLKRSHNLKRTEGLVEVVAAPASPTYNAR